MDDFSYRPELLSPAGNMEMFYAAVSAGADAVYAGLKQFGARAFAGNFTLEEMREAIDYAHLFNIKTYLTLNILIKDGELDVVLSCLRPLYKAGLDAVIIQDIGLISLIKNEFPELDIHISTQAFVTGPCGAELLRKMGVKRVVAARELSVSELKSIKKTGIEVECFIHGAMCYSYSGLCLMSSFLGGRSGNRGRCAGPCRQPYSVITPEGKELFKGSEGAYILSMKDLCAFTALPKLMEEGIDSFKIEGRMKSAEYVYGVTGIYRKYIDAWLSGRKTLKEEQRGEKGSGNYDEDLRELKSIYSRGESTLSYLTGKKDGTMVTINKGGYKRSLPENKAINMRTRPVFLRAELIAGKPVRLYLKSGNAERIVEGEVIQRAQSRPVTVSEIEKQLRKSGGTGFHIESLETAGEEDIFIPVSALNELRRRGLYELKEEILSVYRRSL